ncbi:hypothetical protein TIFTF001_035446 [Ficus carica]|uniref:Jacalin-type lectin domain-containing protein n=1 Tax=Ficus carica TaxID=3494 RepID=A0AA88EAI9_FICCA|nr:hypothetical protein TIFTF001_035446 [Ficus carica]
MYIAKVGPWGGSGGRAWDDKSHTGINTIYLSHGDCIGSFQVIYRNQGSQPIIGVKHQCGADGFKDETIGLGVGEVIVKVSGYFGSARQHTVVRSLTFTTNRRTYGPYGKQEGEHFDFPIQRGVIVGFFGATGDVLDSIGFHLSC